MAISPPSDIVLDVMKAADPAAVREAQTALKEASVRVASAGKADAAAAAFDQAFGAARLASEIRGSDSSTPPGDAKARSAYEEFEAMVLQNFVKSMLPQDSETFFGKGVAGDMWKGMMAEQLGAMLSKGGGIGIADSLMREAYDGQAAGGAGEGGDNLASALLQELQRTTLDGWGEGHEDETSGSGLWSSARLKTAQRGNPPKAPQSSQSERYQA